VRNAQARLIREEIKQSPYPVIVVGDFNSIPLSYVYFTISRGLHDAWSETHWGQLGATCVKKSVGVRIDYILSSDPLVPTECHIPGATGSDHLPVVATLTW
jgi:endonuclease/exonuclease/phosphatase (EEP) superfamily protein YafD